MSNNSNTRDIRMTGIEPLASLMRHQMGVVAETKQRFLRQAAEAASVWSDGIRRSSDVDASFARRLIDSKEPGEAMQVYFEWLTSVGATWATESQHLANMWFDFSSDFQRHPR
jgi:hypothetical protein